MTLTRLKQDLLSPGYRTFILKNLGQQVLDKLSASVADAGFDAADASQLRNRSIIQADFIRQSTQLPETQFMGVSPLTIMVEDEDELNAVLANGWLQLSADTFRWGSRLLLPELAANESIQLYTRYQHPTPTAPNIFEFTLQNIGTDTFQNMTLSAQGQDQLSLDNVTFSGSVSLGSIAPGSMKTVYLNSYSIDPGILGTGQVLILQNSTKLAALSFDMFEASRFVSIYGDLVSVKERLNKGINETDQDERILRALSQASNFIDLELATWGATVPLSPPPAIIVDCCNDWAAGIVRDEVTNPSAATPTVVQPDGSVIFPGGSMNIFIVRAKDTLRRYIRSTYQTTYIRKTQPPFGAP